MRNECRECGEPIIEDPETANRYLHVVVERFKVKRDGKTVTEETETYVVNCEGKTTRATPKRLSVREGHELARLKNHMAELRAFGEWLTDARLEALYRKSRARVTDGYPGDTNGVPTSGGDVSRPVENKALAELPRDDVGDWLAEGFAGLAELHGMAVGVKGRFQNVQRIEDTMKGRPQRSGQGECRACETFCSGDGEDRLRSGYCNPCRVAWDRAGRPDRGQFERERKEKGAA